MVKIISAIGANGEYAYKGKLPWPRNDADMKFFREYTINKTIIMGYNTWESLGRPLPRRQHIVITSKKLQNTDKVTFTDNLQQVLDEYPDGIIIGGVELIKTVCTVYAKYLTEVVINQFDETYLADVFLDTRCIPMIHKKIKFEHYTQLLYFWPN